LYKTSLIGRKRIKYSKFKVSEDENRGVKTINVSTGGIEWTAFTATVVFKPTSLLACNSETVSDDDNRVREKMKVAGFN
jgi:hypothetical protein